MLTLDRLRAYGADTAEGMARCMNNEAFYLRMVGMLSGNPYLDQLEAALQQEDYSAAFEAAHALKGVLANLALTPALTPVSEMTEMLRARTKVDCAAQLQDAREQMRHLLALIEA